MTTGENEGDVNERGFEIIGASLVGMEMMKEQEMEEKISAHGDGTSGFWLAKIPVKVRPFVSVVLIFLGRLFFTTSCIEVRSLQNLDEFIIYGLANIVVSLLSFFYCILYKKPLFPKGFRLLLIVRGLLSAITYLFYAYAVKNMPMGDMSVITTATVPLVVFMAWILLGEPVQFNDLVNLVLTTVGIVLVTQPPMIFSCEDCRQGKGHYVLATFLVVMSCFTLAFSYILIRKAKEVSSMTLVFATGVETALFCLTSHILMNPEHFFTISIMEVLSTCFIGVLTFLVQLALTIGIQLECAGLASILSQTFNVALGFAAQLIIYKEHPNTLSILGIALVAMVIFNLCIRQIVQGLHQNHKFRLLYESICCVPWPCSSHSRSCQHPNDVIEGQVEVA